MQIYEKKLQNKNKKELQIYTVEDSDIVQLKIAKISQHYIHSLQKLSNILLFNLLIDTCRLSIPSSLQHLVKSSSPK